jgi:uncharacterized protein YgiM (DUF1202 family)
LELPTNLAYLRLEGTELVGYIPESIIRTRLPDSAGSLFICAAMPRPAANPDVAEFVSRRDETCGFAPPEYPTAFVGNGQAVNLRDGAGTNFDVVTVVQPGVEVEVLGQSGDGSWMNVRLEDGAEGWIAAYLLAIGG